MRVQKTSSHLSLFGFLEPNSWGNVDESGSRLARGENTKAERFPFWTSKQFPLNCGGGGTEGTNKP